MRFYKLEKLINLHAGYSKTFKIDQYNLLLIQRGEDLFLIESLCPHRGHPLSESDIGQDLLRCPLHGYQFSINDGRLLYASEEVCRNLKTYEIAYQGNNIGIWI